MEVHDLRLDSEICTETYSGVVHHQLTDSVDRSDCGPDVPVELVEVSASVDMATTELLVGSLQHFFRNPPLMVVTLAFLIRTPSVPGPLDGGPQRGEGAVEVHLCGGPLLKIPDIGVDDLGVAP
jgi:hypothetical protein